MAPVKTKVVCHQTLYDNLRFHIVVSPRALESIEPQMYVSRGLYYCAPPAKHQMSI